MKLQDLIIKRIASYFGISNSPEELKEKLTSSKFKLDKQISIEFDDNLKENKNIFGAKGKVGNSLIKVIIAPLSNLENIIIFQFDDLSFYSLSLDEEENNNKSYIYCQDNWIELTPLLLAKLLVGIEQLDELFVEYVALENYQTLYEHLLHFLNFDENQKLKQS